MGEPKKAWCCSNEKKGCPLTEDFDCGAGDWNWQNGWSEEKKTWCCQNQQRGCPGDPVPLPPASDPTTSPTSQPVADSYDCEAGFANWEDGWSEDKKNWCCQNKQTKTCPGDPAPAGPSASDQLTTQTPTESYDCEESFDNYALGWPEP